MFRMAPQFPPPQGSLQGEPFQKFKKDVPLFILLILIGCLPSTTKN